MLTRIVKYDWMYRAVIIRVIHLRWTMFIHLLNTFYQNIPLWLLLCRKLIWVNLKTARCIIILTQAAIVQFIGDHAHCLILNWKQPWMNSISCLMLALSRDPVPHGLALCISFQKRNKIRGNHVEIFVDWTVFLFSDKYPIPHLRTLTMSFHGKTIFL